MVKLVYEVKNVTTGENNYPATDGTIIVYGGLNMSISDTFRGISGKWGKGTLPIGIYAILPPEIVDDTEANKAYKGKTKCWYARLIPLTKVEGRDGLLIHPDGNVAGTLGCLGIAKSEDDDRLFDILSKNNGGKLIVK